MGVAISWRDAGQPFEMTGLSFASFTTVTNASATSYRLNNIDDSFWVVTGAGFTYDGGGRPNGGTVTAIDETNGSGVPSVLITGLSLSASQFENWIQSNNVNAFSAALLAGDDTISGNTGNDDILGGLGNDELHGSGGDDSLNGGAGADTLDGSAGVDIASYVNSTAGLTASLANPAINTGEAAGDTYTAIEGLSGSNFADTLIGDAGDNVLTGNGGDDTLIGGAGADLLDGGAGLDYASYVNSAIGLAASLANPGINTGEAAGDVYVSIERLAGSNFGDVLTGNAGDNTLRGNGGADSLDGGGGFDYASYAGSAVGVTVSLANPASNSGEAIGDMFTSIEGLSGSAFDDIFTGDAGNNILVGQGGADQLDGGAGLDIAGYFNATSGVTVSLASPASNTGEAAGDTYISIEGLAGSNSADTLIGDAGNNVLQGNGADDTLIGGAGADALDGGAGSDYASYVNSTVGLTVSLANPALNTGEAAGDTFVSIERLAGSAFDDILIGDSNDNVLRGNGGADQLNGGAGFDTLSYFTAPGGLTVSLANPALNTGDAAGDTFISIEAIAGSAFDDVLIGDAGNNWLTGQGGADQLDGGGGFDFAAYTNATAGVTVSLANPGANTGEAAGDNFISIEALGGSAFNDMLVGDAADNELRGQGGADVLDGSTGFDTASYFSAAAGVTVSLANSAINTDEAAGDTYVSIEALSGSGFNDSLWGDAGNNTLSGNRGGDVFHADAGFDTYYGFASTSGSFFDGATDIVDYSSVGGLNQGVLVNWAAGTVTGQAGKIDTDRLFYIEGVYGTSFNDTFNASGYSSTLSHAGDFSGYQLIRGGGGNDTIIGNFNTEAIYGDATGGITATMSVFGTGTVSGDGVGTDSLVGVNRLIGSNYNDVFWGTSGNEIFDGYNGGDDTFHGAGGFDVVEYDGRQAISVNLAAGIIVGRTQDSNIGTDTLDSIERIRGSEFDDLYDATGFSGSSTNAGSSGTFNMFEGQGGADQVIGNTATSLVYFNAGSAVSVVMTGQGAGTATATYSGSTATDSFTGVSEIQGSNFNDTFVGSSFSDLFIGGGGNDLLQGNAGNDTLIGGVGADTLDGGADIDTASYSNAGSGVTASLANPASNTGDAAGDIYISIEALWGSNFADMLSGDANANSLIGGNGDDTLTGGGGADVLSGDAGFDYASYVGAAGGVSASLANPGTNLGDAAGDAYVSIEGLLGSNFSDTLIGDSGNNTLRGNLGADQLDGGSGLDTASYASATAGVTVSLANPASNTGEATGDTFTSIEGLAGSIFNDVLIGDAGNNTLAGQGGADALDGGAGFDAASYVGATAGLTASLVNAAINTGEAAGDTYVSIEGLLGSNFADVLYGDAGGNSLSGNGGDDRLAGLGGADVLDGGAGSDFASYVLATAGVTAWLDNPALNAGDAAGDTYISIENLAGSNFADTLTGDTGSNILVGNGGADFLDGGTGFDFAYYNNASAGVTASFANPALNTGDAAGDIYLSIEGLGGSAFNDTLIGDNKADTLLGFDGDDTLIGGAGADTLDGGAGSGDYASYVNSLIGLTASLANPALNTGEAAGDVYISIERLAGSAFNDVLTGDAGDNTLRGNGGADQLDGGAGNDYASYFAAAAGVTVSLANSAINTGDAAGDTFASIENLSGSAFDDVLVGDAGNNILTGQGGADQLDGGAGLDIAGYQNATSGVTVSLANPASNTGEAVGDTYISIEGLLGSNFADTLIGDAGNNTLRGNGGDDTLIGGAGADAFDGGAGGDYASYVNSAIGLTVSLANPSLNTGEATGDTYVSIERLAGSAFNDVLIGDSNDNTLRGNGGADQLDGGAGFDYATYISSSVGLTASLANPTQNTGDAAGDTYVSIEGLNGSSFADTLIGDSADNWLQGRGGGDTLIGGDGYDYSGYTNATSGVTVSLANPAINTGEAAGDIYISIEALGGSDFNDVLIGDAGQNNLRGQEGADVLDGGAGFDNASYVNADAGVTASLANQVVNTGEAAGDTYFAIEGLHGSNFDDTLIGDANNNTFRGNGGADALNGGAGFDYADYNFAPTGVTVSLANPAINTGYAAGDTFISIEGLFGSSFADTLIGDAASNGLQGYLGADALDGGGGFDFAYYGSATSGLTVSLANAALNTGEAAGDTFISIEGLGGSNFGDTLIGDANGNTLAGFDGDDTLIGGAGADFLDGGAGSDYASYVNSAMGITVSLANPASNTGEAAGDSYSSIERLAGSNFGDFLIGNAGDNTLRGNGGADQLDGGLGFDYASYFTSAAGVTVSLDNPASNTGEALGDTYISIEGLSGSTFGDMLAGDSGGNILVGQGGADQLDGGAGLDIAGYQNATSGVVASLATPGSNTGEASGDTYVSIEGLLGSNFSDTLIGDANANTLQGNGGDDTLIGGAGADAFDGGTGFDYVSYVNSAFGLTASLINPGQNNNDAAGDTYVSIEGLIGSNFNDDLYGDAGSNVLIGGVGHDHLYGEGGDDTLRGELGDDWFIGGAGNDYLDGGDGSGDVVMYNMGSSAATTGVIVNLLTGVATDGLGGTDTLVGIESAHGSDFADTITMSNANNGYVFGRAGNDILIGGSSSDSFYGGSGGDTLNGAGGIDTANYFNDGFDAAGPGAQGVTVDLAAGTATDNWGNSDTLISIENVSGSELADMLTGDGNVNNLSGQQGNDVLSAGGGNDSVNGGSGNDTIDGGAGNDFLRGDSGSDLIAGGADIDTADYSDFGFDPVGPGTQGVIVNLASGTATDNWGNSDTLSGVENVQGSNLADTLTGDGNANNLNGQQGNDVLSGAGANDFIAGGSGNDTLDGGAGNDFLRGDSGSDTINGGADFDTADYSTSNFDPAGPATQGVIVNLITGVATDNWGNSDTLTSIESVNGSNLNDTLTLSNVNGNAQGNAGNDTLVGGTGNDNFTGGSGNDSISGGAGSDSVNYSDNGFDLAGPGTQGVTVNLATGTATDNWNNTDSLSSIENVQGSNLADTITGDGNANNLAGANGNDMLLGAGGNDFLTGGAGNDTLDGGTGSDTANYIGSSGAVTVNLAAGTATGDASIGSDTLISIESVQGTAFNDVMTGDASNNSLFGREGNDTLAGGNGSDFFRGGAGNDSIDGGFLHNYARFDRNDFDTADYSVYDTNSGPGQSATTPATTGPIVVNLAAHTVTGDASVGTDTIINVERVVGTSFGDTFHGGSGARAEAFQGRGGNDTIVGDGVHIMRAEYHDANNDAGVGVTISLSGAADGSGTVTGGASVGTDTVQYVNQFYGTQYNDTYDASAFTFRLVDPTFTSPYNVFRGNGGSDVIQGNGYTTLDYSDSASGVVVDLVNGTVTHGASTNVPVNSSVALGAAGTDTISGVRDINGGTPFDDIVYGGNNSALNLEYEGFRGGGGNDTFFGGSGFDEAKFDDGNAALTMGVTIVMAAGVDGNGAYSRVSGDPLFGVDKLYGVEAVRGSLLNDTYDATGFNSGNFTGSFWEGPFPSTDFNRFNGYAGDDTVIGNGRTQIDYRTAEAGIAVDFTGHGAGTVVGDASVGTDIFTGVYGVRDSAYDDEIEGSDANGDTIDDAEIFGLSAGDDWLNGGLGLDFVSYSDQTASVTVNLANNHAAGTSIGTDELFNIEGVIGSRANDSLTGDTGDNYLIGGLGDDSLDGAGGNDTVVYFHSRAGATVNLATGTASDGNDGTDTLSNIENVLGTRFADTLTGDAGANKLEGSDGNDTLTGGAGDDELAGGTGNDIFVVAAGSGNDTVTDFENGSDRFDVRSLTSSFAGVTVTASGSDAVLSFGAGSPTVRVLNTLVGAIDASDFIFGSPAEIAGDVTGSVTEKGGVANGTPGVATATGDLNATDSDSPATFVAQTGVAKNYGSFTIDATGAWSYTLNDNDAAVQALNAGGALHELVTVSTADGTQQVIDITINGANDAAVITGTTTGAVTEKSGVVNGTAGVATAAGDLNATDPDSPATFVTQTSSGKDYGSFTVDATGAWSYTLDDNNAAVQALNGGGTLHELVTVATADGTTRQIDITITGANDAAVIGGALTGSVTEAGGVANGTPGTPTATGTVTVSDVDSAATFVTQTGAAEAYGSWSMTAAGAWTYTLNNANAAVQGLNVGGTLVDTFTVTTSDGTTRQVGITINGANDAAVITGSATGAVTEKSGAANGTAGVATATGDLNATDVDNAATFVGQTGTAKTYGSFTIDATGAWSYTLNDNNAAVQALNAGGTLHELVTVATADGTTRQIDITINGGNDAAVIMGTATGSVTEKGGVANGTTGIATATGDLDATDVDSAATFVVQTGVSKTYGSFTIDATGAWSYTLDDSNAAVQGLNAGGTLHELVTVATADGTTRQIDITINGANDSAVITGAATGSVTEKSGVANGAAGVATATGDLDAADVDSAATFVAQTGVAKTYGGFTIDATGAWSYTLDDSNAAVQGLNAGGTLHELVTVATADGTTRQIDITINGGNDAAVITGTATGSVTEKSGVANGIAGIATATGDLDATDVDSAATFVVQTDVAETYGSFTIDATGAWSYTLNDSNAAVQGLNAGGSLHELVTVATADGTTRQIDITINGANDSAVITGMAAGSVTEKGGVANGAAGVATATGDLDATDVDSAATFVVQTGVPKSFGTFSINAAGTWSYTLNDNSSSVQALNAGDTLHELVTVATADGTTRQIDITINGADDAPVISGTSTGWVVEAGGVNNGTPGTPTASGTLTVTDVDNPASFVVKTNVAGSYGTFSITSSGAWTYTLNNSDATVQALNAGDTLHELMQVSTTAGDTTQLVDITISGTNDAAVIIGATVGSVTEMSGVDGGASEVATGSLEATDVDSSEAFVIQTDVAKTYGSFSIDATGAWSYTLDDNNASVQALNAGGVLHDLVMVATADGTTRQIDITINGINDAAVIGGTVAGTVIEAGGVNNGTPGTPTATGTVTASDVDSASTFQAASGTADYGSWSVTAGGVWTYTLNNADAAVQALNAGDTLTDAFAVTTADGTTQQIDITIDGANDAAVITGTTTGSVTEKSGIANGTAGIATVTGDLDATDIDNAAEFVAQTGVAKTYGSFTIDATGAWSYTLNDNNAAVQALNAGGTLHELLTVATADGTTRQIDITINGANDAAVITGTATGSATEKSGVANGTAGVATATGDLNAADPDSAATFVAQTGVVKTYGSFTIDATGAWSYTLNDNNAAVQALNAGGTLHELVMVATADGTTRQIDITINGANDAAEIGGTLAGSVTEAGGVANAVPGTPTATGTVTASDVDNALNTFQTASGTSVHGSWSVTAGGVWTYTLNNADAAVQALNTGSTLGDAFMVTAADGTTRQIDVTINGTNDSAVLGGTVTGSVTEAGGVSNGTAGTPTATGTVTASDVDNAPNTFQAASGTSAHGSWSVTAGGVWTYTLHNADAAVQALNTGGTLGDAFMVTAADGTTRQIDVTISGTNDSAVLAGTVTGSVTEAGGVSNGTAGTPTATGTVTANDVDNAPNTFQAASGTSAHGNWSVTAGGVWTYTLNNADAAVQALNTGSTLGDAFMVTTADGTTRQIDVTINGTNDSAVLAGTVTGSVTEAGGVSNGTAGTPTATGTVTASDVDNAPNTFQAASGTSAHGSWSVTAGGGWTYTLNNADAAVQVLSTGSTLGDAFTVTAADGTTRQIDITINGANDAAVITGTATGAVMEKSGVANGTAGVATATGDLNATDIDGAATLVTQTNAAKTYGSFTIDATGAWSYVLDDGNAAVQGLNAGGTLHELVTVATADGTTRQIDITINGANDAAVVGGTASGSVTEAGGIANAILGIPVATGTLTVSDVDSAAAFVAQANAAQTYGSFTINAAGVWSYTLNNSNASVEALNAGDVLHDHVTVATADGTTRQIDITINGSTDQEPPAGQVSISDVTVTEGDGGTKLATFTVTRSGGTTAFSINYATSNGTATVADGDYIAKSGTLTFGAGVNSQTISVLVNGDATFEAHETFFVTLSGATAGATLADGTGMATIRNDDPLEAFGTTKLFFDGGKFFLGSATGPSLKYEGVDFTEGQFASWKPIAVETTEGGGYQVAWKNGAADLYVVWNLDSNGNFVGNAVEVVPGSDMSLVGLEATFAQDLNGDGQIGPMTTTIEDVGQSRLVRVGGEFFLRDGEGEGPSLKFEGEDFVQGQFGAWTPVAVEPAEGDGYLLAWKNGADDQFMVWNLDDNGNYVDSATDYLVGADVFLKAMERTFDQDLNGDGIVGSSSFGTDGDDALVGTSGADVLFGFGGNDAILGLAGDDLISGGTGNDDLDGGQGSDVLAGDSGADRLFGGDAADYLLIDSADTAIDGGAGFDSAFVQDSAAVTLDMGASSIEWALGSDGADTFNAASQTSAVYIYGLGGDDTLTGSAFGDYIDGGDGIDTLAGGNGDDLLVGNGGSDILKGEGGDDYLIELGGDSVIEGGTGFDSLFVWSDTGVSLNLATASIEWVQGSVLGDDSLNGAGNTVSTFLYGWGGNDTLKGGSGDDYIAGGAGNDVLTGGRGNDTLIGESGTDRYVYTEANWGSDTIHSFDTNGEKLDFTAVASIHSLSDFTAFEWDPGNLGYNSTTLFHSSGGTTSAITLIGVQMSSLSDSDFLFV